MEADPFPWPPHAGWVTFLQLTLHEGKKHQIRNKRIKITKLPDRVVRLRIKKQTAFMAK